MPNPVRYSDADLLEFKTIIDDKLEKAETELQYLRNQISEAAIGSSNQKGGDYFDDSNRHTEIELLNNMASRQAMFIRNLKNALLRIQNKTYGICTITGALISKERLKVVPHATKTIAGKNDDKKMAAARRVVKRVSTPKVKSKIISKPRSKTKTTPPLPEKKEEDLILNVEEIPQDMIPKNEEGFADLG